MATWFIPLRARLRLDTRLWLQARGHLNIALRSPSPASLQIETIPYPTAHPDASVFEPMSEEYASVSIPAPPRFAFTPLSSSDMLANLVSKGDFQAADALRKELIAHHMPIPRDVLYLRAALHAITQRRSEKTRSAKKRLDAFEAWLSLAPDRHEEWQSFHNIRQRLFRSMDHLNLTLVYRFGIILASKGYYSGDAAMQVVSTLARYAQPSDVETYLRQVGDAALEYHSKLGTDPPSDLLASAYNLSVRTVALGGKGDAALTFISIARSHGVPISDFTLHMVAKHAPDRQIVIGRIQAMYPSWTLQDTNAHSTTVGCAAIPTEHTTDVAALTARLRALRIAFRSPCPPSPQALHTFVASCQALGRTRAIPLLRALAYRHSSKSAATWAFTEMLHHRARREHIHLLFVFVHHFHLIGVPRKTVLSLVRGARGQQARQEHVWRWVVGPIHRHERLWPSAYHTALVWEALVSLSSKTEKTRLYALLISLVRRSRRPAASEPEFGTDQAREEVRVQVQLPPDTYDAAHFSPFVSSWARWCPARAAGVLKDMVNLGVEPSVVQWSMVARGYAQHDNPNLAMNILDRLEKMEWNQEGHASKPSSDAFLGIHTNVLRGFVIAEDLTHAREVEKRLVERLGYLVGDRPTTDASIALLRGLEERLGS